DPVEQEIVRQRYAGFIARHSHDQMMRWQQKFSGVEDLKKQLEMIREESKATQQRLSVVEAPLIKARQAEEEQQRQRAIEAEARERQLQAEIIEEQRRCEENRQRAAAAPRVRQKIHHPYCSCRDPEKCGNWRWSHLDQYGRDMDH
ncbi:MAG TPA: hypothetical protein DER04_00425, partial [Holosporales bacterium]|nr:hypothetical protein [Holosporales bacterium]